MTTTSPCDLCRASEDPNPNRIGGLDLCRRCYDGGAVAAAEARGLMLRVVCGTRGLGDKTVYAVTGTGSVGKPLFDARFHRKGLVSLAGVFGMTLRVSDPLFHDLGVIITRDKPRTRMFIDLDGPQSAIMDLLGEDISVRVERSGRVSLSGARKHDPYDPTPIERELAVLLVHLDRYELAS